MSTVPQGRIEDLTDKVQAAKDKLEKRTLNVKELAKVLGVGETKARELCRSKGFPALRIGNRYLIPITRFEEWLNNSIGQEF